MGPRVHRLRFRGSASLSGRTRGICIERIERECDGGEVAACKKLLRVEVETEKVDAAFDEVTRDFQRHARLPGFRAGKAPRHLVIKAYDPQIQDEVRRKVLSESFREALREQKLDLVGRPEVEETQFGRGKPLQFTATFEIAPEFELPDYRGLPVRREVRIVTPEDVERAVGDSVLGATGDVRGRDASGAERGFRGDQLYGDVRRQADHGDRADREGATEEAGDLPVRGGGSVHSGFHGTAGGGAVGGEKRTVTAVYPRTSCRRSWPGLPEFTRSKCCR